MPRHFSFPQLIRPDDLYLPLEETSLSYAANANTGNFDLVRALEGKPCFADLSIKQKKGSVKKTLFLADPNLALRPLETMISLAKAMNTLHEQGFSFAGFDAEGGMLVFDDLPLTTYQLENKLLNIPKDLTANTAIAEAACALGLSQANIFPVNVLTQPFLSNPHKEYWIIWNFTCFANPLGLMDYFAQSPYLESPLFNSHAYTKPLSGLSLDQKPTLLHFLEKEDRRFIVTDIRYAEEAHYKQVVSCKASGVGGTPGSYLGERDQNKLLSLLKNARRLQRLTLEKVDLTGKEELVREISLDHLETILLDKTRIEQRFLLSIAQKSTDIKKLSVSNCDLAGELPDEAFLGCLLPHLTKLEQLSFLSDHLLKLDTIRLTLPRLHCLLVNRIELTQPLSYKIPSLQTLSLTIGENDDYENWLNTIKNLFCATTSLKTLSVSYYPVNKEENDPSHDITELSYIEIPPQDKTLKLEADFYRILKSSLPTLETLYLRGHFELNLIQLLTFLPNLKSLDIDHCRAISPSLLESPPPLNLEKISFYNSTFEHPDLVKILESSPLLHTLTIQDERTCQQRYFSACFSPPPLNLKSITLDCFFLDTKNLVPLLKSSSKLNELSICTYYSSLDIFSDLPPACLPQLRKAYLRSSTDISDEEAAIFLKAAPGFSFAEEFTPLPSPCLNSSISASQDTSEGIKTHEVIPYFASIPPTRYRLNVSKIDTRGNRFTTHDQALVPFQGFTPANTMNKRPGLLYRKRYESLAFFLPSLWVGEGLEQPEIRDLRGLLIPYACFYSTQTKFYKIVIEKGYGNGPFWVSFSVTPPPPSNQETQQELMSKLDPFIHDSNQKRLSCENRTHLMYKDLERLLHPIEIEDKHVVTNDCHAYLELKVSGQWHTVDLGGTPAKLITKTAPPMPHLANSSSSTSNTSSRSDTLKLIKQSQASRKPLSATPFDILQAIKGSVLPYNAFLLLNKNQKLDALYRACAGRLLVVTDPAELVIDQPGLTLAGELKENDTRLSRYLSQYGRTLTVVIDLRAHVGSLAGELNDLLDRSSPELEGVRIILVDEKEANLSFKYGDDIQRRLYHSSTQSGSASQAIPVYSLGANDAEAALPPMSALDEMEPEKEIDLFHSPNSLSQLLGHFRSGADGRFFWQMGDLAPYIEKRIALPTRLVFKNPPRTPEFDAFIDQWRGSGRLELADQHVDLPAPTILLKDVPYDPTLLSSVIEKRFILSNPSLLQGRKLFLLGETTLSSLMRYRWEIGSLGPVFQPSVLEQAQAESETLLIMLSPYLTQDSLAAFLLKAHELGVKIQLIEYTPCPLLAELSLELEEKTNILTLQPSSDRPTELPCVCFSDHPAKESRALAQTFPESVLVNAATLQTGDLSYHVDIVFNRQRYQIEQYHKQKTCILMRLEAGQPVILYGTLSDAIREEFMELCLQPALLASLRCVFSKEEKTFIEACLPSVCITDEWKALRPHRTPVFDEADVHFSFQKKQVREINAALCEFPLVVLEGPTGVGKSSLMKCFIKPHQGSNKEVYTDFFAWLTTAQKEAILFLDEANLIATSDRDVLPCFENAWAQSPPQIYWRGEFYPLEQKKVVLIQNASAYGNGRRTYSFLSGPTLRVNFHPFTPDEIGEIIDTALISLADQIKSAIKQCCLRVYTWFFHHRQAEQILTGPRDMQAVCFLVRKWLDQKDPNEALTVQLATDISSDILYSLADQRLLNFEALRSQFKQDGIVNKYYGISYPPAPSLEPDAFIFSSHHMVIYNRFAELLYAHQHNMPMPLGGIFLLGLSDIGKTAFFEAISKEMGFTYETLPAQQPLSQSKAYLTRLKTSRSILLINEFNTHAILLEKELNELLDTGNCLLLASGNPPSLFPGRKLLSPAIQARLFCFDCTSLGWTQAPAKQARKRFGSAAFPSEDPLEPPKKRAHTEGGNLASSSSRFFSNESSVDKAEMEELMAPPDVSGLF